MKIKVHTNKGVKDAMVIRENAKTWIVQLPDGKQIKRHKRKHAVEVVESRSEKAATLT